MSAPPLLRKRSSWARVKAANARHSGGDEETVTGQQKILHLYWQSVFVWNLWSHFGAYCALLYLALFYAADALALLGVFQLLGGALVAVAVLPLLFSHVNERAKADRPRKDKAEAADDGDEVLVADLQHMEQNSRIFWPRDCESLSAHRYPLSLALFVKPVKLYDWDELQEKKTELRESMRRALYAMRILRYSNPTQFTFVMCMLCSWGVILTSYFSAKTIIISVVMFAMFLPGLLRRNVFYKLRRRLEANKTMRRLLDQLIVDENPNLEETNTQKVMSFVTDTETKDSALPKVIATVVQSPDN